MRHPLLPLFGAALLLLVTGGLTPSPASAAADCGSGVCLTVHRPDGSTKSLSGADLTALADVHDAQYRTRARPGGAVQDEPYVQDGVSVHHVLESLSPPVDPGSVGFLRTTRRDGSWSTLSRADVAVPSDFADGLLPVLRVDGGTLEYVRPLRPGDEDTNAEDELRFTSIELFVRTGALLSVRSSATPSPARPRQQVALHAEASGGSSPYAYRWDFGDGSTGEGADVAHAYADAGNYRVLVTASGPDDAEGAAQPLVLGVADASASPVPASAPSTAAPPSRSPAPGTGTGTGQSSGPVVPGAPGAVVSGVPTRAGSAPVPTGAQPDGAPYPAAVAVQTRRPAATRPTAPQVRNTPRPRPARAAPLRAEGVRVSGILLAVDAAPYGAGVVEARAPTSAAAGAAARHRQLTGLGASAAVVGLLLLGAAGERRRPSVGRR